MKAPSSASARRSRTLLAASVLVPVVVASSAGLAHAQASVLPSAETTPVPSSGDAADDPVVWVHPTDRALSTVIGTDKHSGLAVYDLAGNQLQFLADGDLNNVDLRYGFALGASHVTLVTSGERSQNVLAVYAVDADTRLLHDVSARAIPLGFDVYGWCMYRSPFSGETYCFMTSETGHIEQWKLFDNGAGRVDAFRARTFEVGSVSEGCVADDESGSFFVSEENVGIWSYGAEPSDGTARVLVDATGIAGHLTADVEGLTIYYASGGAGYLLASSQGSSTFVVYDRRPPYAYRLTFQVADNTALGIDGVSGTDGIDVMNLGLGSAFPGGLFVTQDDSNPGAHQNFKLVPWNAIAAAASPALLVDSSYDVHGVGCASAFVTPRNGSGINPFTLTAPQVPRLGAPWEGDLDCAGHAPGTAQLWAFSRPATGPLLAYGQLLVDPNSTRFFSLSARHSGNLVRFGAVVPADLDLCGLRASLQAMCLGSPGPVLSNALDLGLGF